MYQVSLSILVLIIIYPKQILPLLCACKKFLRNILEQLMVTGKFEDKKEQEDEVQLGGLTRCEQP